MNMKVYNIELKVTPRIPDIVLNGSGSKKVLVARVIAASFKEAADMAVGLSRSTSPYGEIQAMSVWEELKDDIFTVHILTEHPV